MIEANHKMFDEFLTVLKQDPKLAHQKCKEYQQKVVDDCIASSKSVFDKAMSEITKEEVAKWIGPKPSLIDDRPIVLENDKLKCIALERNGSRCIRLKRAGNYCWFHNPLDPKICRHMLQKGERKGEMCGEPLQYKKGINVTSKTNDSCGIFENKCHIHMHLKKEATIAVKKEKITIVGFKYNGKSPSSITEGELSYEVEPNKKFDSNAVKVLVNGSLVGYVT